MLSFGSLLVCCLLISPTWALIVDTIPEKRYGIDDAEQGLDARLRLGGDKGELAHISREAKHEAATLSKDEQVKYNRARLQHKQESLRLQEWLNVQMVGEITAEVTSRKGPAKSKDVPTIDTATLLATAVDAGQEDTFVAISSSLKAKLLNQSAALIMQVNRFNDAFKDTAEKASSDIVLELLVKNLFENLKDEFGPYQTFLSTTARKVNGTMPANLQTLLAPYTSIFRDAAGNPFDVPMLVGLGKDRACEKINLVFAGLGPFRVMLKKAHKFLNSTASVVALANQDPKAFLVPRLTSMPFIAMLALEQAHRSFMSTAAPTIMRRFRCGPSTGHVLEEAGLGHRQQLVLQRREQKKVLDWIQTETTNRRGKAVVQHLDEAKAKGAKFAAASVSDSGARSLINSHVKDARILLQERMASFVSDVRSAAQEFVVDSLVAGTKQQWIEAYGKMKERLAAAETRMDEHGMEFRRGIDSVMPKSLMPYVISMMRPASNDLNQLRIMGKTDASRCKDVVRALEDVAFKYGGTVFDTLRSLDRDAYAMDFASGAELPALKDVMEAAYSEALGMQEAAHALISIAGPAIAAQRLGCPKVDERLKETRWWKPSE